MTLKQMAEQILLRKYGSAYTDDANIDEREVYDLVIKAINKLIKTEYMDINLPMYERYVNGSAIATYDVAVTSDTGARIVSTKCSTFPEFSYSELAWSTADDEGWATEDDEYWSLGAQGAQVVVTEISQSVYRIALTGFSLPSGKTPQDIERFILSGSSNSYLRFNGAQTGTPSLFAKIAINNLIVGENVIRFDYHWQDSLLLDQDILSVIGETNNILIGSNTYTENIPSISVCEVTITDTRGRAKIALPAHPISLPHGMGIWSIGHPDDHFLSYVPVQPNEMSVLANVSHTGLKQILAGQTAYEWFGHGTVVFNKLATEMPSTVRVRLVVVDPSQIAEDDLLPIPADYEASIIEAVLNILAADGPADLRTDKQPIQ